MNQEPEKPRSGVTVCQTHHMYYDASDDGCKLCKKEREMFGPKPELDKRGLTDEQLAVAEQYYPNGGAQPKGEKPRDGGVPLTVGRLEPVFYDGQMSLEERPDGNYVSHEDYESLLRKTQEQERVILTLKENEARYVDGINRHAEDMVEKEREIGRLRSELEGIQSFGEAHPGYGKSCSIIAKEALQKPPATDGGAVG